MTRCTDCALLAAQLPTLEVISPPPAYRQAGKIVGHPLLRDTPLQCFCFAGCGEFPGNAVIESAEEAVAAMTSEHKCPAFVPYRRGLSHREVLSLTLAGNVPRSRIGGASE
jgi:hypothetical protein